MPLSPSCRASKFATDWLELELICCAQTLHRNLARHRDAELLRLEVDLVGKRKRERIISSRTADGSL